MIPARTFALGLVLSACIADPVLEPARAPRLRVSADTLLGVHFAGDPDDPDLDRMMDGRRGFAAELVYADEMDDAQLEVLRRQAGRGLTVILRVDPSRGQVVPLPGDEDAFARFFTERLLPGLDGASSLLVLGNEPNLDVECRQSGGFCDPDLYVAAYRRVRQALRLAGSDASLLVTAMSPGAAFGPRTMDGDEYFWRVLSSLAPEEVDGIAIHAYGGPGDEDAALGDFTSTMEGQLALFAATGHGAAPVFLTEMNRASHDEADEAVSARFLRRAFDWVDAWNRAGGQPIVAACWFEYAASPDWPQFSLQALRSGSPWDEGLEDVDVWHAFRAAARRGHEPGPGVGLGPEPEPEPEPESEPEPEPEPCACLPHTDNVCLYGVRAPGCPPTWPGGYCDPNGDGDFTDADWVRGWYEHRDLCGIP